MIVNDFSRGLILASLFFCGCSGTESTGGAGGGSQSVGGAVTTGGSLGAGGTNYLGATGLGGSTSLGGSNATAGGASNSAGTNSSGGAANTGGSNAAAGNTAAGGATSPGGSKATGGNVGIGGSAATAGSKASGGITGTGGASSGGTMGTGGTNATGGNTAVTCGNNPAPASCSVTGTLQAVPQLPRNSCKSNSLPQAWGDEFRDARGSCRLGRQYNGHGLGGKLVANQRLLERRLLCAWSAGNLHHSLRQDCLCWHGGLRHYVFVWGGDGGCSASGGVRELVNG